MLRTWVLHCSIDTKSFFTFIYIPKGEKNKLRIVFVAAVEKKSSVICIHHLIIFYVFTIEIKWAKKRNENHRQRNRKMCVLIFIAHKDKPIWANTWMKSSLTYDICLMIKLNGYGAVRIVLICWTKHAHKHSADSTDLINLLQRHENLWANRKYWKMLLINTVRV